MRIDIVSVFPEYFGVLNLSLLGKAQENGLVNVTAHNLRDWTHDMHHSVDDTPVGGGAGMVMKPEVWGECLDSLLHVAENQQAQSQPSSREDTQNTTASNQSEDIQTSLEEHKLSETLENTQSDKVNSALNKASVHTSANEHQDAKEYTELAPKPILIFPNPSAPLFTQQAATELSYAQHLIFGCGRYEGYDARIPQYYRAHNVDVREYSIGDYVLNGGEVAVSVMLEAITRLLPGFMGNPDSIVEESYTGGNALLEHKQYTKPSRWREIDVPEILLSGNHAKVNRYRRDEAIAYTDEIRPDLIGRLNCAELDKADRKLLIQLGWEVSGAHPRRIPSI